MEFEPPATYWLQKGDGLRDVGRHREAASCYERYLVSAPHDAGIWVQLGNMLKDAGQYSAAEAAYTTAIECGADPIDTNLQLGRARKLAGRRDEALLAFTQALKAAPYNRPVIDELIALGEGWTASQQSGVGSSLLIDVIDAVTRMKASITRLETALPTVSALAAFPIRHYQLYREVYKVPAPAASSSVGIGVIIALAGMPILRLIETLQSLRRQSHRNLIVTIIAPNQAARSVFEQETSLDPARFPPLGLMEPATEEREIQGALDRLAGTERILLLREPLLLDLEAAAWFASGSSTESVVWFTDDDMIEVAADGEPRWSRPTLRACLDPELLDQGVDLGVAIAAPATLMSECLVGCGSPLSVNDDWLMLCRRLAARGKSQHLPHALVSRFADSENHSQVRSDSQPWRSRKVGDRQSRQINVIIPTRDGFPRVQVAIDAMMSLASSPDDVMITVVDNGSKNPELIDFLQREHNSGHIRMIVSPDPFNWSRLNNDAAQRTDAPMLLFMNDDVECLTPAWDDIVRYHLGRAEIGAVGARLLYPDGSVQHAGIALGFGPGRTEHEGRFAAHDDPGPDGRWLRRRTVSAVTGAFLACRRSDFQKLGGFEVEHFGIWFSDVDFCLRLGRHALRVLYEPAIVATHYESKTLATSFTDTVRESRFKASAAAMWERWGDTLLRDPWVNPRYSRWNEPFEWLGIGRF